MEKGRKCPELEGEYSVEQDEIVVEEGPEIDVEEFGEHGEEKTWNLANHCFIPDFDRDNYDLEIDYREKIYEEVGIMANGTPLIQEISPKEYVREYGEPFLNAYSGRRRRRVTVLLKRSLIDLEKELLEPPFNKYSRSLKPDTFWKDLDLSMYLHFSNNITVIRKDNRLEIQPRGMYYPSTSDPVDEPIREINSLDPGIHELVRERQEALKALSGPKVWSRLKDYVISRYLSIHEVERFMIRNLYQSRYGKPAHISERIQIATIVNAPIPLAGHDMMGAYYNRIPQTRNMVWLMELLSENSREHYQKLNLCAA